MQTIEDQHLDAIADTVSQHIGDGMSSISHPDVSAAVTSYAAWLEEEGNPLGKALKLHLTIDALERQPERRQDLRACQKELEKLLGTHGKEWTDGLDSLAHTHYGLPGLPLVAEFHLDENDPQDVIDAIRTHGRSLITVSLIGGQGNDVPRILEQAPHLRSMNIEHCSMNTEQTAQIAEMPTAGQLRQVALQHTAIDAAALEALLKKGNLSRLSWFDASFNTIGPDGAHALRSLPLPQLRELLLAACDIEDRGVGDLLLNVRAKAMRVLGLGGNEFSGKGMHTLSTGEYPELHRLILGANDLGKDGSEQLACADMPALTSLFLAACNLTSEDAMRILSSRIGTKLAYMDLQANPIHDAKFIRAATRIKGEKLLPMQGFSLDPDSAEAIGTQKGNLLVNLNSTTGNPSRR